MIPQHIDIPDMRRHKKMWSVLMLNFCYICIARGREHEVLFLAASCASISRAVREELADAVRAR